MQTVTQKLHDALPKWFLEEILSQGKKIEIVGTWSEVSTTPMLRGNPTAALVEIDPLTSSHLLPVSASTLLRTPRYVVDVDHLRLLPRCEHLLESYVQTAVKSIVSALPCSTVVTQPALNWIQEAYHVHVWLSLEIKKYDPTHGEP